MQRSSRLARLGVFLIVIFVVVVGSSIGPYLASLTVSSPIEEAEHPEYSDPQVVPERAQATGDVQAPLAVGSGTVLIDRSHLNRFEQAEIQRLVSAITATGHEVEFLSQADDFDAALSRADAFIVIDPGSPYSLAEVNRVESFVDSGGRLLLIGEPTQSELRAGFLGATVIEVTNQFGPLPGRFGIQFGESHLYNMESNDGNHVNIFAKAEADSSLVNNVDRTALYTATQVESDRGTRLLIASDGTRNARGDSPGRYALAVRDGNVLAIGDKTFLGGANYNVVDNEKFISNIVGFLITGDKQRSLVDYPAFLSDNLIVRYTSPELLDAAQTVGSDLRANGHRSVLFLSQTNIPSGETDVLVTTYDDINRPGVTGTGLSVIGDRVSAPGYNSNFTNVVMIRDPPGDIDIVIAADTPENAVRGAEVLEERNLGEFSITNTTAVIRIDGASDETTDSSGTDDEFTF